MWLIDLLQNDRSVALQHLELNTEFNLSASPTRILQNPTKNKTVIMETKKSAMCCCLVG